MLLEQIQAVGAQNKELNSKATELVKNNLENLFLKKQSGQDMAKVQGEVTSLTLANEELMARVVSLEDEKNSLQVSSLGLISGLLWFDQPHL